MNEIAGNNVGFEQAPSSAENGNREFFTGQLTLPKVSANYKFGLFVVTIAMISLPVIYLGIVAFAWWGTYWYAIHGFNFFFPEMNGVRHIFFVLLFIYLVPLGAGAILSLFLLKPLFASWPDTDANTSISHVDHPVLFRFIGQLCQQMGAPIPSRIDVNISINAGAGFREGFRSMFGNDIVLSIGLPLVAGLTCRQFAGLMAHELGHFTQRTGMRMKYMINAINSWLGRAVYERDSFDVLLYESGEENSFGALVSLCASIAIGTTRGIVWVLFMIGYAISSYMSRQMEFHADACEIAVSGSQGFISTSQKSLVLMRCRERAALEAENRVYAKLPDDMSAYLAMLAAQCAGQTQEQIFKRTARDKTRWFWSHPAEPERTKQAIEANEPGIIHDDRPATILFNDFSKLSTELTTEHYKRVNRGRPFPEERIFHVQPANEEVPDTSAEETAIKNYFCGLGMFLRPIVFDSGARLSAGLGGDKAAQITQARRTLEGADLTGLCGLVTAQDSRLLQVRQVEALIHAGGEVSAETSGLAPQEIADISATRAGIEAHQEQTARALEPFEKMARQRMMAALSLVRTREMAATNSNAQHLQDEVHDLLHVMEKLRAAFPPLLEARKEYAILGALLGVRGDERAVAVEEGITASTQRLTDFLAQVHKAFGSAHYPFDPPERHRTIVDYARAKQYDPDPARMVCREAECHLQGIVALYHRVLARLIQISLQVESLFVKTAAT